MPHSSLLTTYQVAVFGLLAAFLQPSIGAPDVWGQNNRVEPKLAAADGETALIQATSLAADELFKMLGEADAALRAFDYPRAAELYERITKRNPYNGDSWMRLARCQEQLKQYDRAIAALERGLELGDDSSPGRTQYQIATLYMRLGQDQSAIDWLEKAMQARHEHRPALRTDKRWDPLRSDPRFARLAAEAIDAESLSRHERWSRDLDHLAEEAARMHPLWREGDRAERFSKQVEAVRRQIDELSDEQMLLAIDPLLVVLGDGHSHRGNRGSVPASPRLPLQFYFFADGLYVIDAAEPYRDLIGCRVERFGQVATADVEKRLESVVSRDNPMGIRSVGPLLLVDTARLASLGIIEAAGPVTLAVTDRDGQVRIAKVAPAEGFRLQQKLFASKLSGAPAPPLYLARVDENLWFERLADSDALFVQFNQVVNQQGRQLADVAKSLRQRLAEHPPKALIVDLRHNGGGNTYFYAPLLKTILFYELLQPEGKVFVLIGRSTFSAAQNFTNDVDRLTDAIFVGEPTGSRPNFAGESTQVVLPYSGVGLSISTRIHAHAYATDRRIWIAPDVAAELSSAAYFANRDPALEAIRAIIGNSAAANAASGQ